MFCVCKSRREVGLAEDHSDLDLIIPQKRTEHLLWADHDYMPREGHESPEDRKGLSRKTQFPTFPMKPPPTHTGFLFSKKRDNILGQSHLVLRERDEGVQKFPKYGEYNPNGLLHFLHITNHKNV